jgi:Fe-S cluster assembly iron-binding protein IscA
MITLTERAAEQFKSYCKSEMVVNELRLVVEGGGCEGLTWKIEQENRYRQSELDKVGWKQAATKHGKWNEDAIPERQHGVKLYVSSRVLDSLKDATIDYVDSKLPIAGDGASGYQLLIEGGKSCGCGFSIGLPESAKSKPL